MELKQLRYFVVCTDVGSFSAAAEILNTTQPNVSKVIRNLEQELGAELFIRNRKGIQLTARGSYVYEYAVKALMNIDHMSNIQKRSRNEEYLLISSNASKWMASCFSGFYNQYKQQAVRFQLHFANVAEIVSRVSNYQDEIGFVYIMENQNINFHYMLQKKELSFVPLERTHATLYLGQKHPQYESCNPEAVDLNQIELVQSYWGELNEENFWHLRDEEGDNLKDLNIKVVTNSSLVIDELLSSTGLANIGSSYIVNDVAGATYHGFPVHEKKNQILFGYICRKETELSIWAGRYVDYVKKKKLRI